MDNYQAAAARTASDDFVRARRKAFFNEVVSLLRRQPNCLMHFDEVQSIVGIVAQHYRGMQQVPVSHIVGSVDRYRDFDRSFLPTQTRTRPRWESVDRAALTDVALPPVQLYKVGGIYFVKDGNHRVSVAREKGVEFIDAEVTESVTNVPVTPGTNVSELLQLAERARFFEQTNLDRRRENVDIRFTSLGRYNVLLEHISGRQCFMGMEQDRTVEWPEAVLDWYDCIYLPVAQTIEENRILDDFPGRTAADLYLWIMDHRWYLREETGYDVGPYEAAIRYDAKYANWTRKVLRSLRRLQAATTRPVVLSAQAVARAIGRTPDTTPQGENILE